MNKVENEYKQWLVEECPVRDKMLVDIICSGTTGCPVGTRYRMAFRPCGTFRIFWITFFYPHFVPNGTVTPSLFNFLNKFLKNKSHIFDTPIVKFRNGITSFLPNLNDKTTSVEDRLTHFINLITSFFAKGFFKLGNDVLYIWTFIHATEVVLFWKLGKNEVFVTYPDGYGLKAFYNHV